MKKIVSIFVILLTLMFAGLLWGTHNSITQEENLLSIEQAYNYQYPETMPDMVIDPMFTLALY